MLIKTKAYGFYKPLVWYVSENSASKFVERLIDNIEKYDDENWINMFPKGEDG